MIKLLGFASIMMMTLAGGVGQANAMNLLAVIGAEESAEVVETALDTQTQEPSTIEPAAGEEVQGAEEAEVNTIKD